MAFLEKLVRMFGVKDKPEIVPKVIVEYSIRFQLNPEGPYEGTSTSWARDTRIEMAFKGSLEDHQNFIKQWQHAITESYTKRTLDELEDGFAKEAIRDALLMRGRDLKTTTIYPTEIKISFNAII